MTAPLPQSTHYHLIKGIEQSWVRLLFGRVAAEKNVSYIAVVDISCRTVRKVQRKLKTIVC
jgi:hypothetical protein